MQARKKVAIFSSEPVTGKVGGLGVRQLEIARELSKSFDLRLLTPFPIQKHNEKFKIVPVRYYEQDSYEKHIRWADVAYATQPEGSFLRLIEKHKTPLAIDLFPIIYFEELEHLPTKEMGEVKTSTTFTGRISHVTKLLASGDFFICSGERERDYYLGILTMLGKVRPNDYHSDSMFRSLIDTVPFGIPKREPKKDKNILRGKIEGVGKNDFLIVWGGAMWNWYDCLTTVKAMARLETRCPKAKLVFTATKHPATKKPPQMYTKTFNYAKRKGLLGKNVFFYSDWVPHDQHEYYLTESDAGIVTFPEHIENHFSFRIRVVDYLWGNLPVLTNPGNILSDLIDEKGLGFVTGFGDDKALAEKIELMVKKPSIQREMRKRIKEVKKDFHWNKVLAPLVKFCKNPTKSKTLFEKNLHRLSFYEMNRLKVRRILFLRSSPMNHSLEALKALKNIAPDATLDVLIQPDVDASKLGNGFCPITLPSGEFNPEEARKAVNSKQKYDAVVCATAYQDLSQYENVIEFALKIPAKHHWTFNEEYQFTDIKPLRGEGKSK